jgi:site-specific recombinase XerD
MRVSPKTRDYARAIKRAADLDTPGAPAYEPLGRAVEAFALHCLDLEESTRRKYQNVLTKLKEFLEAKKIDTVSEVTTEDLDAFRSTRKLSPVTSLKELQTLGQFFGFCFDRRWIGENVAKKIKGPRNIRTNDVEPYTANEVARIIAACDTFGRGAYERTRARAMILLLRFTALRTGDVAMLSRDRIAWDPDGERWRIFLRTEKTGAPVFLPIPDALKQALDVVPNPSGKRAGANVFIFGMA